VSDAKVAMQSRLLSYSNTTATAARLHHIADMLIAGENLSRGRFCHTDCGNFVIREETSSWGGRHLHGGGDFVIPVQSLRSETL